MTEKTSSYVVTRPGVHSAPGKPVPVGTTLQLTAGGAKSLAGKVTEKGNWDRGSAASAAVAEEVSALNLKVSGLKDQLESSAAKVAGLTEQAAKATELEGQLETANHSVEQLTSSNASLTTKVETMAKEIKALKKG